MPRRTRSNGVDPAAYYVRREDYEAILQRLGRGEQIYDMLVELAIPGVGTQWAARPTLSPIQYEGSPAVLGWFYDITDRMRSRSHPCRTGPAHPDDPRQHG